MPARTVLWLGELRHYVDADDGQYVDDDGSLTVLGRLGDLLDDEGHLVITTVWPEQWTAYTAAARAGSGAADPARTAGLLLERLPELADRDPAGIERARGGVIDVPDQFTPADLEAVIRTGDSVLISAAAGHRLTIGRFLSKINNRRRCEYPNSSARVTWASLVPCKRLRFPERRKVACATVALVCAVGDDAEEDPPGRFPGWGLHPVLRYGFTVGVWKRSR